MKNYSVILSTIPIINTTYNMKIILDDDDFIEFNYNNISLNKDLDDNLNELFIEYTNDIWNNWKILYSFNYEYNSTFI